MPNQSRITISPRHTLRLIVFFVAFYWTPDSSKVANQSRLPTRPISFFDKSRLDKIDHLDQLVNNDDRKPSFETDKTLDGGVVKPLLWSRPPAVIDQPGWRKQKQDFDSAAEPASWSRSKKLCIGLQNTALAAAQEVNSNEELKQQYEKMWQWRLQQAHLFHEINFPPQPTILHPLLWCMLQLMILSAAVSWSSSEWEWAQLEKSIGKGIL